MVKNSKLPNCHEELTERNSLEDIPEQMTVVVGRWNVFPGARDIDIDPNSDRQIWGPNGPIDMLTMPGCLMGCH